MNKIAGHDRIGDAIEERANLIEEMRELIDGIEREKRDMTATERASYDSREARANELTEAIDKYESERNAPASGNAVWAESPERTRTNRALSGGRELGAPQQAALRAMDESRELSAEAGDSLDEFVRRDRRGLDSAYLAAVSDPAYRSAFGKRLARPETAHQEMTPAESAACARVAEVMAERRAMSVGTDGSGGYGVPFDLDPSIQLVSDGSVNPLRELATVTKIEFADSWHGIASEGIDASFYSEAAEVSDDSPTLTAPTITPERAAVFIPYSEELGDDWDGFAVEISKLIADAKDQLENGKFVTGAGHGSQEPEGLLAHGGTISPVSTGGASIVAVDDIYGLQEAVPARFSPRAQWLGSNATLNSVYRMVAAADTDEAPLVAPDRTAILGRTYNECSAYADASPATAVPGGASIVSYGDVGAAYRIVDRIGMSVEIIPHLFGSSRRPTGQRGMYARWRTSGGVINDNAIRHLKVKS